MILYGSETGNAQDVAEETGGMAERLRFDTTIVDMDSADLRQMIKSTVTIFVISTTGQGEMPQNARLFWKALLSSRLSKGVLRKVRFSSFGLGDSSYARFNVSHRMLYNRLTQLGAQSFCDRGEGNEQHPEGHSAGFREWTVALRQGLMETFPLPSGVETLADDVFLEPKWKLDLMQQHSDQSASSLHGFAAGTNGLIQGAVYSNGASNGNLTNSGKLEIKASEPQDVPSRDPLPIRGAHTAHIISNDRMTAPDHFQDVRLLDLHLKDHIEYAPGAVAVIYPKNFPQDVDEFINLMNWHSVADTPLKLIQGASSTSRTSQSPSPLRYLDLTANNMTLRWLVENVLDIMSIPRRSFFASLIHFAGESNDDEAYQKERLVELANPELIDELWDYTTRPKRTILEVMMDFTTIQIPWQYALSTLPLIKGRQFSIASGGHLRTTSNDETRVQLLVAIADPPSPIIKWRRRYGVCTRYIAALKPGQIINIGMQPGYLDVQPSELEVPVVMIGPGTGLAPMRSMIWQRLLWAADSRTKPPGARLKDDILVFGCRNESGDYFFHREWEHLSKAEDLTVLTAFSRDKDKPREYVQDRIRANASSIREALLRQNGKVYVCGSSGNMPKGVREALLDVLSNDNDSIMTRENAESYLDNMEKAGRYKQETW